MRREPDFAVIPIQESDWIAGGSRRFLVDDFLARIVEMASNHPLTNRKQSVNLLRVDLRDDDVRVETSLPHDLRQEVVTNTRAENGLIHKNLSQISGSA